MFLETLTVEQFLAGGGVAGIIALGIVMVVILAVLIVALYVYMSFAFMVIAKKTGYPSPGIAWIPGVGPALIMAKAARMSWWPILLMIGFVIPVINWIFMIALAVFLTIWLWKTFEVLGRPGWWAILSLIKPLNLIFIGIAAWGNSGKSIPMNPMSKMQKAGRKTKRR
jgi:uncharacterized membrane protein (DUF373 family)